MPDIEIRQITDLNDPTLEVITDWMLGWWGVRDGMTREQVRTQMGYSVCQGSRLPQTFAAFIDGELAGSYQLSMSEDLYARPDLYPWLINLFVNPEYRGRGVARAMIESVPAHAKAAGLTELFLYTKHVGLYEKFGWQFQEFVETWFEDSPIERLYKLEL